MDALGATALSAVKATLGAFALVACASSASETLARAAPGMTSSTQPSEPAAVRTVCEIARDVEPMAPPELALDGAVSQDNLRAWVHALAGPDLRGREAGTADSLRAARLISEYFSSLGARAPSGLDHCMTFSAREVHRGGRRLRTSSSVARSVGSAARSLGRRARSFIPMYSSSARTRTVTSSSISMGTV